jgi:hypothetical protein
VGWNKFPLRKKPHICTSQGAPSATTFTACRRSGLASEEPGCILWTVSFQIEGLDSGCHGALTSPGPVKPHSRNNMIFLRTLDASSWRGRFAESTTVSKPNEIEAWFCLLSKFLVQTRHRGPRLRPKALQASWYIYKYMKTI